MKAIDVAYYIIKIAQEKEIYLSDHKLQKLLYYVQGYYLKEFRIPAFEEDFEHWTDGPVIRSVFREKKYHSESFNTKRDIDISKSLTRIINEVLDCSKDLSTAEIIEKTHLEDPWKNHNSYNEIIPKKDILEYFDRNDPLDIGIYESNHLLSDIEKRGIYTKVFKKRSKLFKELSQL